MLPTVVFRVGEFRIDYWETQISAIPAVARLRAKEQADVVATNGMGGTVAGEMQLTPDASRYEVFRIRAELEHPNLYGRIEAELAGVDGRVRIDRLLAANRAAARPRGRYPASIASVDEGRLRIPVEAQPGHYMLRDGTAVEVRTMSVSFPPISSRTSVPGFQPNNCARGRGMVSATDEERFVNLRTSVIRVPPGRSSKAHV